MNCLLSASKTWAFHENRRKVWRMGSQRSTLLTNLPLFRRKGRKKWIFSQVMSQMKGKMEKLNFHQSKRLNLLLTPQLLKKREVLFQKKIWHHQIFLPCFDSQKRSVVLKLLRILSKLRWKVLANWKKKESSMFPLNKTQTFSESKEVQLSKMWWNIFQTTKLTSSSSMSQNWPKKDSLRW